MNEIACMNLIWMRVCTYNTQWQRFFLPISRSIKMCGYFQSEICCTYRNLGCIKSLWGLHTNHRYINWFQMSRKPKTWTGQWRIWPFWWQIDCFMLDSKNIWCSQKDLWMVEMCEFLSTVFAICSFEWDWISTSSCTEYCSCWSIWDLWMYWFKLRS